VLGEHVITAVEPGPKRGRVVVRVDDEPVLDLPRAFAEKLDLVVGRSLAPGTQDEIRRQAALHETKVVAVQMLGRRALTQAEMRRRLLSRRLPEESVAATLEWLAELGYLDDEQYAERRWELLRQRQMGTQGIVHTLRHEGVPGTVADEIRSRQDDAAADEALARQLAEKRNAELNRVPWPQRRQRLYSYLARRGFDGETIAEAIGRLEPDDSSSEVSDEA
jgi:regulatory protein